MAKLLVSWNYLCTIVSNTVIYTIMMSPHLRSGLLVVFCILLFQSVVYTRDARNRDLCQVTCAVLWLCTHSLAACRLVSLAELSGLAGSRETRHGQPQAKPRKRVGHRSLVTVFAGWLL